MSSFKHSKFHIFVLLMIFLLTLASRIIVRLILRLAMKISRGPSYVYGLTHSYQLALPIFIAWSIFLGIMAILSRHNQYELTHTRLFLLSILDMLAALFGDILYLVLEYSKTWFSIIGFSQLGEFLINTIYLTFSTPPSILLGEIAIILALKHPLLLKHLNRIAPLSLFILVVTYSEKYVKRKEKLARMIVFISLALICFGSWIRLNSWLGFFNNFLRPFLLVLNVAFLLALIFWGKSRRTPFVEHPFKFEKILLYNTLLFCSFYLINYLISLLGIFVLNAGRDDLFFWPIIITYTIFNLKVKDLQNTYNIFIYLLLIDYLIINHVSIYTRVLFMVDLYLIICSLCLIITISVPIRSQQ